METKSRLLHDYRFIILLAIVFCGIALRLHCFRGFVGLDDAEYAKLAYQMAQNGFGVGNYNGPAVFPLRVGIIYPASILFRLFGVTEWSIIGYSFFLSIIGILIAYICTRYCFGTAAGLVAAAIWAILPLDVENSTYFLPDLPGAFFASTGLVCILFLIQSKSEKRLALFAGGFLAGITFGISWLCKETVLYLVPFCVVLCVIMLKENLGRNGPTWIGIAIGSLGIVLAEMILYHYLAGDLLFRFNEMERNYLQLKNGFFTEGSRWGWQLGDSYLRALSKRLLLTGPKTIFLNSYFLFMPLFGLIASFHALYWKDRSFFIPALWLLTVCAMFNFSSSSLSHYTPLALFERYLYPICLPSVVLTAGLLRRLISFSGKPFTMMDREKLFWGAMLLIFIILIGGYQTFRSIRDIGRIRALTSEVRVISNLLKPWERIYTDPISQRGLEFFWKYDERINIIDFEGMSIKQIPPKSFVLTNRWYADWLNINAGMWLSDISGYKRPEFFRNPPPSWKVIWGNDNAKLYHSE